MWRTCGRIWWWVQHGTEKRQGGLYSRIREAIRREADGDNVIEVSKAGPPPLRTHMIAAGRKGIDSKPEKGKGTSNVTGKRSPCRVEAMPRKEGRGNATRATRSRNRSGGDQDLLLGIVTLRAFLRYSSAWFSSPLAWLTWSPVRSTKYSMRSTNSPCRAVRRIGKDDGVKGQRSYVVSWIGYSGRSSRADVPPSLRPELATCMYTCPRVRVRIHIYTHG